MLKQITESFNKLYNTQHVRESFAYKTKHGLGPGMIPRDVRVIDWEEPNDYDTIVYINRELTPQEMSDYELEFCGDNDSVTEDFDSGVREYSDMLFDMIEEGIVDAEQIAKDLIYWCSEDDIKRYMEVNDIIDIDDFEDEDFED